jgi:hypothetical protein
MDSVLKEIHSFNEFFKKIPKLNTKRQQLEGKLSELAETLRPFSSQTHEIPFRNGKIVVTRKHLQILEYNPILRFTMAEFGFYEVLKNVPNETILALGKYVNRYLRNYLPEYLLKAKELRTEFIYAKKIPLRTIELIHYYDDEPTKITFDTVKMIGTELQLTESASDDDKQGLVCHPFKFTIQRTLNALLLKEQFPEIFTIYDELLEQYNQDLDYNFKVVREMEQIIRPFLLAKEFGRNDKN